VLTRERSAVAPWNSRDELDSQWRVSTSPIATAHLPLSSPCEAVRRAECAWWDGAMSLEQRWPVDGAHEVRDGLLEAYADPGRGYHDLAHLTEVLDRVDELMAALGADRVPSRAVRLAAWFHDGVYDGEPAAEERSAAWVSVALAEAGLPADEVAEVARLVRLTAHHRAAEDDLAGCVLSDADLAILASPPERYADYVAGVRWEYRHLADDDFRRGRAAVLRDLVAGERLFHTGPARQWWEAAARANVSAELVALSA
jgi:predicted metal-dependent HD superfamily phosphohydrolase